MRMRRSIGIQELHITSYKTISIMKIISSNAVPLSPILIIRLTPIRIQTAICIIQKQTRYRYFGIREEVERITVKGLTELPVISVYAMSGNSTF